MKGYSFDELVKLAMAAVKRAGDTMTGNLTAPKFIMNAVQGTGDGDAVRYDYLTSQLPERATRIPGGADLNTYQTAGFYYQDSNADAISGSNYPTGLAGSLTVLKAAGVTQEYRVYSQSLAFKRGYYDGAWSAWQKVYDAGNKPTAADVDAVSKAGDTMTGNLNTPRVLVSGVQGGEGNALTRKDYVDSALASKLGNTGEQTISGELVINSNAPILTLGETDTGKKWLLVADNYGARFQMDSTVGNEGWAVNGAGSMTLRDPHTMTTQGTNTSSLTRKDYVDGQVAARAPMAHTHTVANITDLKPQAANAAANTLALRDSEADVHARLLRTTFVDESRLEGAIAFRVNNLDDNYTRYCSNPTAVRNWMSAAKTAWEMYWRALIEHTDSPMTEYHIPGKAAVASYLSNDGNYRISTSDGYGYAYEERLRLDASGNLFSRAAIYEAGQRVYSPNNQPHYSHNHTAAQGNADIVASGYGQIGTYAMLKSLTNYNIGPGSTLDGNSLQYVSCSGASNYAAPSPSGTWKCLGIANAYKNNEGSSNTLWVRIA